MTSFQRAIVALASAGILLAAFLCRFSVVPTARTGGGDAYVLDRWTGQVRYISGEEISPVKASR